MIRTTALLTLAGLASLAAEDLRLLYFLGQQEVDVQPSGESSRSVDWDESARYEIGAFERPGNGSVGGFALGTSMAEASGPGWDLEYQTYTLRVYAGWDLALSQGFGLEIMPFTGIGMASGEMRDAGGSRDDRVFLIEYGAVADLYLSLSDGFMIGAGVSYEMAYGAVEVAGDIEPMGLSWFGFLSIRF